jgi:hypothetical protein
MGDVRWSNFHFRPTVCKNAGKIVGQKIDLSERPVRDFLRVGKGNPTRENFETLRFYTAWAKSRPKPLTNIRTERNHDAT